MDGQPRQQQFYRDHATGPQAHRYRQGPARNPAPSPEEFDHSASFSDFFSQFFDNRAEAAQAEADSRYAIDIDFLEAANGGSKHVTLPDGRTLDLKIPAGVVDGQKLRLKGQGAKRRDGTSSDALVELHVTPHPRFTRTGNDVTIEVAVALQESVLGLKIPVPTLTGTVEVAIPKGSSSGSTPVAWWNFSARKVAMRSSQFLPPRSWSPAVARTSTPEGVSCAMVTSNVPPPRS